MTSRRDDPPAIAANGELSALLQRAIEGLPAPYRQVFVLREVEGLDTAETAAALDASAESVKTRLHRAKTMLHRTLIEVARQELGSVFTFHAVRCDRVVHAFARRLQTGV